jgi:hypothetical protein
MCVAYSGPSQTSERVQIHNFKVLQGTFVVLALVVACHHLWKLHWLSHISKGRVAAEG